MLKYFRNPLERKIELPGSRIRDEIRGMMEKAIQEEETAWKKNPYLTSILNILWPSVAICNHVTTKYLKEKIVAMHGSMRYKGILSLAVLENHLLELHLIALKSDSGDETWLRHSFKI